MVWQGRDSKLPFGEEMRRRNLNCAKKAYFQQQQVGSSYTVPSLISPAV